ncbi:TetR family transcriptional regulator [Ferrimonas futtsuensis]|uniref:TetR family transcriptional regulator n=1 Tax=Ferrimonas futtsuensis TaxID=364764 RepID=UPI00040301C0|nr:TetR family transcriptional regulator [Ferrimonas futtsuensis]
MTRECAKEKLARIHKATKSLAAQGDIKDLSIYAIAREAAMAASSVYHHYPNVEDLVCRMTQEELEGFKQVLLDAIEPDKIRSWKDINYQIEIGFANHYNSNCFIRKVILGHHAFHSVYNLDESNDLLLGDVAESVYRRFFDLPPLPQDVNIFSIAMQAADRVYGLRLNTEEAIPEHMIREAVRLTERYLGGYLPEYLPPASKDLSNKAI